MNAALKTAAIGVAVLFLLGVVLADPIGFLGGSKTKTLFEGSADALAEDSAPPLRRDAGPAADAGAPEPEQEPVFFPASKSMGGHALPGLRREPETTGDAGR